MTDYIRIKYAGYYFEYTKYDVNPSVYYDKPVLDDIKEVLDKRAWNIQELNLCYINLRYEFSEYYDNDFETIRKELIELEEKLETEYRFQFGESGYFRLTPRNKYQEEPVYEEQMDEICTKCGRIIPRVERRIYIDRGLGVIQNGGRADEGAAVHRYCPYCEENGLISYATPEIFITSVTGCGKIYIACAFGMDAYRKNIVSAVSCNAVQTTCNNQFGFYI